MPVSQELIKSAYLSDFMSYRESDSTRDPKWLADLPEKAISRFAELGFPTARRGNEEWKYTNIAPISGTHFRQPTPSETSIKDLLHLPQLPLGEESWHRLVFVNNTPQQHLSSTSPEGIAISNLAQTMDRTDLPIQKHLGRYADYSNNAFTALNTAFLRDGACVYIPKGVVIEKPIHVIHVVNPAEDNIIYQPRTLIVAEEGSKAIIIEGYYSSTDHLYFSNSVSEIVVASTGNLQHHRIQDHNRRALHVGTTEVHLGQDSNFFSMALDTGGGLVRNNLNVITAGERSSCMLNGIYLASGSQHVDNQVIIDHSEPYTTSRELYKGILDDEAKAIFHGSIIVRQGAKKVDSQQVDRNLLLSDRAEANTKPAFWIYADEVKCGHGATNGKLDEESLFYLTSRGLDENVARMLLVRGFASEVTDTIPNRDVRTHIENMVHSNLAGGWDNH